MIELLSGLKSRLPEGVSFEDIMNLQGEVFRDVAGRKTIRCELGGFGYFVKTHTGVGWKEIFKNLLQGKWPVLGARQEFLAIKKLQELNIETMNIAGFGQKGLNPASLISFIVTEELSNTISLEDYCAEWPKKKPPFALKFALVKKVANIARILHTNGVNHRDFYICHFLLEKNSVLSDKIQLSLIDLHRVQIRKKTPERWVIKDIAALYYSVMDIGLTQRDLYRFIKIYKGMPLRNALQSDPLFWNKVTKKALKLHASVIC